MKRFRLLGLVSGAPSLLFLLTSLQLLAIVGFGFVDSSFDVIHLLPFAANLGACNNLSISLT